MIMAILKTRLLDGLHTSDHREDHFIALSMFLRLQKYISCQLTVSIPLMYTVFKFYKGEINIIFSFKHKQLQELYICVHNVMLIVTTL